MIGITKDHIGDIAEVSIDYVRNKEGNSEGDNKEGGQGGDKIDGQGGVEVSSS